MRSKGKSPMEAVYTLMKVNRGVPETWGSVYDVRELLKATYYAVDKKPLKELHLTPVEKLALKKVLKKIKGTDIEKLLQDEKLI